MQFLLKKGWYLLISSAFVLPAMAQEPQQYRQEYDAGHWLTQGDAFECRLSQTLSGVAQGSFVKTPGQPLSLRLQLLSPHNEFNSAHVQIRRADWHEESMSGGLDVKEQGVVEGDLAHFNALPTRLLSQIPKGFWLDFIVEVDQQPLQLTFTSIDSAQALLSYQECLRKMAPLSWEEARNYDVTFESGQRWIRSQQVLNHLKDLVRYIELDGKVSKVLIDGHTDSVGSAASNRALSQDRADEVASRLAEFGLQSEVMEVRAHGSRYPIASNRSDKQGANRRVQIRLVRDNG